MGLRFEVYPERSEGSHLLLVKGVKWVTGLKEGRHATCEYSKMNVNRKAVCGKTARTV